MAKVIEQQGSVRVDLVGGTLDLDPIAQLLKDTVTLNMATTLKAKVVLETTDKDGVGIYSNDYQKEYFFAAQDFSPNNFYYQGKITANYFKEMLFVVLLCQHFGVTKNIKLTLSSGAPAGSGLGGSSAMGITLAKTLLKFQNQKYEAFDLISQVRKVEEMILSRGVAGYQDYFPAVYGGILALTPRANRVLVEQLYHPTLANFLAQNITLVYSGKSRLSGINNWEVYKAFFDEEMVVVEGLTQIASISAQAYQSIKNNQWPKLLEAIAQEGALRETLFANIVTTEMKNIQKDCAETFPAFKGIKVCGAGGGGCFLLVGVGAQQVKEMVAKHGMQILPLEVAAVIDPSRGA